MQLQVARVLKSDVFCVDPGSAVLSAAHNAGTFVKVKRPVVAPMASLADALRAPMLVGSDWTKSASMGSLFAAVRALDDFCAERKELPRPWHARDADAFVLLARKYAPLSFEDSLFGRVELERLDEAALRVFAHTCAGSLQPLCALFGGSIGQEAQKALSGKFTPQKGFLIVDGAEVVASKSPQFDPSRFALMGDRMDALRVCVGDAVLSQVAGMSLFMIGVGAIG